MVGTVIAPSLSGISTQLNFNFPPGWLITLPSLGVVVFAPIIGKLLNKFGPYKMLCIGLIPYALLGFIGCFITNDYLLILDRFLLGGATVALQVSTTTFIANYFSGEQRIKLVAAQGMAIELGGVIFLSIGGVLGEWHWQYPFYIYLLGIIFYVLVRLSLSGLKPNKVPNANTSKSNPSQLVRLIFISALLAMVLFFVGFVTLPLYLPNVIGFSESVTGYYMAFISLIAIITASQMPKVVAKLGDGNTVALGFVLFMFGYIILASFSSTLLLIVTAICIGIGFGFTIPLLNHMMIEVSSNATLGKNLGLYSMAVFGGQFLSTFIEYVSKDYTIIYGTTSVIALGISVPLFVLFKRKSL